MILFTDLDGTLLTDSKELTKENQDAIREAIEAGHKVVISTGRPLAGPLRRPVLSISTERAVTSSALTAEKSMTVQPGKAFTGNAFPLMRSVMSLTSRIKEACISRLTTGTM